jgi:hypothetical protein
LGEKLNNEPVMLRGVFLSSFVYFIKAAASQILYKIKADEAAQVFFYDFY